MDNPVTQFLTPTQTLVSTYVNKTTRHLFYDAFSGKLCYFTHTPIGVTFLADTGSVPNLIKLKTIKKYWPRALADKIAISLPIQGVGGNKALSSFVYISFCNVVVPFCVSEDVPFNIIGIDWIPVIANLPNFIVFYQLPSEVSTALTVLYEMDLITPPFSSKCMNAMCECCEPGQIVTRSIPPPEDAHISEEPVGAGQPSNGVKDVPVCNVRTQFPEYSPSEEDGIVVVSSSCVQDAQVSRCEQGVGQSVLNDECDERYLFVTNDKLSVPQAEALLRDLITRKKNVELSSGQEPSRVDFIPREQWYAVYEPFHSQLTDLKGHLRGPQTLPYLCTVNLVDPKTPPFTCPAYPMRHPEQKKRWRITLLNILIWVSLNMAHICGKLHFLLSLRKFMRNSDNCPLITLLSSGE